MSEGLKAITIQVPKKTTVNQLLLDNGLKPDMYFASKNDQMLQLKDEIEEGQAIKVIPIIAGG